MTDDVDMELVEAEARRRSLAETLGGTANDSDEDVSDHESEAEVLPGASSLKVTPAPLQTVSSVVPKVKLSRKQRLAKSAVNRSQVEPDVDTIARGHPGWTVAETKKEFDRIFSPYFTQKLKLPKNEAVQALAKLRATWAKDRADNGLKDTKNAKAPKILKSERSVTQSIAPVRSEQRTGEDVTMVEQAPHDVVGSTAVAHAQADVPSVETKRKGKRKRTMTMESTVQSTPTSIPVAATSVSLFEDVSKPAISKSAAKREAKRLRRDAKKEKAAERKLNLVNSKDWYKNDEQQAAIVHVPEMLTINEHIAEEDNTNSRKIIRHGPTKSDHFLDVQSTEGQGKKKSQVARNDLIASLSNDLLRDQSSLGEEPTFKNTEEANDADSAPTFFSSDVATLVNQTGQAQARSSKPGKNQEKMPNLGRKQRRALAAERNREQQLASNEAARDPVIERTVIETKIAEQSVSFLEMVKRAKQAVQAAAATVEVTVKENAKLKKNAPSKGATTDAQAKRSRRRKRNNNRSSEAHVVVADAVSHVAPEIAQEAVETKLPLQTAIVNEQEPTEARSTKKRSRKSKAEIPSQDFEVGSKADHS